MTPTVSVVIPAYRNAPFIEAAVESVLAQTYTDFELIVSDHSSDDGTWEKLQRFTCDPRVSLMQIPTGGGAPANWDAVSARATGTYLKLLCGDDLIYPTCLEQQVAAIAQPGVVLVASPRDIVDAHGKVLMSGRGLQGIHRPMDGRAAVRRAVLSGSNVFGEPGSVLMLRETFENAGGWDARDPYVLDLQTYCHVLQRGGFAPVTTTLAAFRMNQGQWTMELIADQKSHVRSFQQRVAAEYPGTLSARDLNIAHARAHLNTVARRGAYMWMRRKLDAANAESA